MTNTNTGSFLLANTRVHCSVDKHDWQHSVHSILQPNVNRHSVLSTNRTTPTFLLINTNVHFILRMSVPKGVSLAGLEPLKAWNKVPLPLYQRSSSLLAHHTRPCQIKEKPKENINKTVPSKRNRDRATFFSKPRTAIANVSPPKMRKGQSLSCPCENVHSSD